MTVRLLCAGEALIDMLPGETIQGAQGFVPFAGGAVFNTAIALGRLGIATGLFSGLSNDLFGQILVRALAASNVDAGFAARSDRPTTLAFVTLKNGAASYAFYDENTAGRMLEPSDIPDLPASVEALFFGGISLAVEPCAEIYAALLERHAGTKLIMLDPNIRPSFITDEERYRARLVRLISKSNIVKLSDEDLAWLQGDDSDASAKAVLAMGPSALCVTYGGEGAAVYTKGQKWSRPARSVEVADTVGAGDTFNAGVLAALADLDALSRDSLAKLSKEHWEQVLDLGIAAAAITVSRSGANPPLRSELEA